MLRNIIVAMGVILLTSCGGALPPPADPNPTPVFVLGSAGGVRRYHDGKYGVTCWIYSNYNQGGIWCIPDAQLDGDA